ncbi:MAG TPA: class I SAM-dependent methyltransferase [Solirubrobacteraceae bacterium]|nr:class I SAM-dependent methyltransferase [Solirubrobacteraceae bacterium]
MPDVRRVGRQLLPRLRSSLDVLFSRTLRPGFVYVRDALDRRIERRHGLDTFGKVVTDEHDVERGFYRPLPWGTLARILREDEVGPDDVFLDLGAGKGRAVFLAAARYPFKRVIGVELSEDLSAIARANIERVRDQLVCQDVQIVTSDVLDYDIPDDATLIFLYNPFRGHVFESVIQKLLESVDRLPRRMRVIYLYPTEAQYLRSTGRFRTLRRARGWRPTPEWSRSYDTYLLDVLPSHVAVEQQAP